MKNYKIINFLKMPNFFHLVLLTLMFSSCSKDSEDNHLPIASFTFEGATFYAGEEVNFENLSADRDGEIVNWSWDFGDGNTSEEESPKHIFEAEGAYDVTLTVEDDNNGSNSLSKTIEVQPAQPAEVKRVKIMTLNIHRGVNNDGEFDLDGIAEFIKSKNPDYVALQEVDLNTKRNGVVDIPKILSEKTNMYYRFGKTIDYQGGEFGNAVLSINPIESDENIELPSANEQRAALKVNSKLSANQFIDVISTHLDYGDDEPSKTSRKESATLINNQFANDETRPAIIAGDFNEIPASEAIKVLSEKWTFADVSNKPTFPSTNPTKKIDYIAFYPSNRWKLIEVTVIEDVVVSDHAPLMVTLDLILN